MSIFKKTIFLGIFFLFCFSANNSLAANLLTNQGFENGTNNWSLTPSTATMSATTVNKHGGEYGVTVTKSSSSWAYISQKVTLQADKYYRLSGWALINDAFINNVKLRFYWLDASDAKISDDPTEVELANRDSSFKYLETPLALAPGSAQFADVQAYVFLDSGNPANPAVFDDLNFEEIVPSPTPTAAPTSEPTDVPEPTATPTPKPPTTTPTPRPTNTPKPSPTPTELPPLMTILGESSGSNTDSEENVKLGDSNVSLSSSFLKDKKNLILPGVMIVFGLSFVGFSVFTFLKARKLPKQPIL